MTDIEKEVKKVMREYGQEVSQDLNKEIGKASRAAAKELRASSPKKSGKYAQGWTSKIEVERLHIKGIVYNKSKPSIAHLLENGHATRNGNGRTYPRTLAHPHILKVEEEVEKKLIEDLKRKIGG